jgi:tetrahydrodipicolinate N-succinyltransferase
MLKEAIREQAAILGVVSKFRSSVTSVEGACHVGCPSMSRADEDVD